MHAEGQFFGESVKCSMRTRMMKTAQAHVARCERLKQWEPPQPSDREETPTKSADVPTIREAMKTYLDGLGSKSGKNLLRPTVSKHRTVTNRLADFAVEKRHLTLISDIDFDVLDQWRTQTWDAIYDLEPQTAANYIFRLRKMGKYFRKKKWWAENFAEDMELPEDYDTTERLPLEEEEMNRLYEPARSILLDPQTEITNWEIETFIMLMHKGGMTIGDAALFENTELRGDELHYVRKKRRRGSWPWSRCPRILSSGYSR